MRVSVAAEGLIVKVRRGGLPWVLRGESEYYNNDGKGKRIAWLERPREE